MNTSGRLKHPSIEQFPVQGGELVISGHRLSTLAARVSSTPFYAYSRLLLRQRVEELRAMLPHGIKLHYAMKANPMPALVHFMAGLIDGIDVASAGELKIALDAGVDPVEISFAGPGKRDHELRQSVAAGVLVNVESFRELPVLAAVSRDLGLPARVAVRVNPDFELKGWGMKMGGGAKQFGIDVDRVPEVLSLIGRENLTFEGFHLFAGSQSLRVDSICEVQQKSYALALRLSAHAPGPVKFLHLGGGFGVPYFPGEQRLDLAPIGANLAEIVARAKQDLPQARIVIELGRYLVAEAGIYVVRVLDRKVSRGQVFLVTDGGLHHQLAATGNFGQVIRKNYPLTVSSARLGNCAETETVSVVGPLCTPLDLLADRIELPIAEVGDFLVVFQSGAYGLSASPERFLGHPPCVEVLV